MNSRGKISHFTSFNSDSERVPVSSLCDNRPWEKKDLFLETISTHSKDGVRGPWPTKIIQYKNKWLLGNIFVLNREESEASIDRMRNQGLQSKV